MGLDALGATLLQRVRELMAARPDLDRLTFGRAIGRPTPSWLSEFFSGNRTTNDLRLVVKIARVFGVPVGYLLNERADEEPDAPTLTLLGAWRTMERRDREILLQMAIGLVRRNGATDSPQLPPGGHAGNGGAPHTSAATKKSRPRKHQ